MAEDLIFYTNPMSRGRIARWMLEEVGQPYRTEIMSYESSMKALEYLAINPMGKVPAIKHGDEIVTECGAICAYLADAFPQAGLAPPLGSLKRGPYFRWMFFAAGPVEAVVTNKSLGFEPSPDKQRMVGYGSYADVMTALEVALSKGDYLLGDTFSAADVYFGSHIGWGMQFGGIEARPVFERYNERLRNRPAAIRAAEIDDALIAAAEAPSPVG